MNFLSRAVCDSEILILTSVINKYILIIFTIVFSIVISRFIVKKLNKRKKIKYPWIYIVILSLVLSFVVKFLGIIIFYLLAKIISDNFFFVDPKYKVYADYLPSYGEMYNFNVNFIEIYLMLFSLFSYFYFKIVIFVKTKKINKYILGGFFILLTILSIFGFFNLHEHIYNKIEDSYECEYI